MTVREHHPRQDDEQPVCPRMSIGLSSPRAPTVRCRELFSSGLA